MKSELMKSKKAIMTAIIVTILIITAGVVVAKSDFFEAYKLGRQMQEQQRNQSKSSEEDKKVLKDLKKIILLPEDVTPTMAVISDIEALKKSHPDFFVSAKNGDRVIAYSNLTIVYDWKANKIINIGPLQLNPPPAVPSQPPRK